MSCCCTAISARARPRSPRGSAPRSAWCSSRKARPSHSSSIPLCRVARCCAISISTGWTTSPSSKTLGFDDLISDPDAITLIEWPERAVGLLPDAYLLIELDPSGPDRRTIRLRPVGLDVRFTATRLVPACSIAVQKRGGQTAAAFSLLLDRCRTIPGAPPAPRSPAVLLR